MKYIVLAGGFATRLWPLTEKRAKPLLMLAGKTILAHIFDQIPAKSEVFLLTNEKFIADFKEELSNLGREDVEIFSEDAFADGEKLGAVKALSLALDHYKIDDSVCVIAGDNVLPGLSFKDMECHDNDAIISVREVESLHEARKFGVVQLDGKKVTEFVEKPEKPASKIVSTGFFSFGKKLIPLVHECAQQTPDSLGSVVTTFLSHDASVSALRVGGEWFDVGSFETYLLAHNALQEKEFLKGKKVKDHDNVFAGKVYLGDGCELSNCKISDSIIYPGVRLENCHISRSIIDKDCVLEGVDMNQKLVRANTVVQSS